MLPRHPRLFGDHCDDDNDAYDAYSDDEHFINLTMIFAALLGLYV